MAKILALVESYNDSYLEFREDKYMGPFIHGGNVFRFSGDSLSSALTKKQWHHLSISISKAGYSFKLNGVLLASLPSGELNNWARAKEATLTLGNFDGWIDEIVIRNVTSATSGGLMPAVLTPLGPTASGFKLRLDGKAGTTYRIQASENGSTWTNAGSVHLTKSDAEFVDPSQSGRNRFYRAVVQP